MRFMFNIKSEVGRTNIIFMSLLIDVIVVLGLVIAFPTANIFLLIGLPLALWLVLVITIDRYVLKEENRLLEESATGYHVSGTITDLDGNVELKTLHFNPDEPFYNEVTEETRTVIEERMKEIEEQIEKGQTLIKKVFGG